MQDDRVKASISNAIVRAFRLINRVHNRRFASSGVSAEQAHILLLLSIEGPMTIGALQKRLALSSATLTGAIDRLEAEELVRRVPSPTDRRAFVLEARLSAKKRAQLEAIADTGEEACFGCLTAQERRELLRILDKCIASLEPQAAAR